MITSTRLVRTVACYALLPTAVLVGGVTGASSASAHEPPTSPPARNGTFPYAEIIHALGDIPLAVYIARHEATRFTVDF